MWCLYQVKNTFFNFQNDLWLSFEAKEVGNTAYFIKKNLNTVLYTIYTILNIVHLHIIKVYPE